MGCGLNLRRYTMKNKLLFVAICVLIVWILSGAIYYIKDLCAEELTEVETMNKYYTEEMIKNEMRYLEMWQYTESMTEEEYCNTFLR